MTEGPYSDPGAQHPHVSELDAAASPPMVGTPGDPGNGEPVRAVTTRVPVEVASGGTCPAGKSEDMDMYALVLADALRPAERVADSVKFYIRLGSEEAGHH